MRALLNASNREAKLALQTWFKGKYRTKETLAVFCVSTTEYISLITENDERTTANEPLFTPELTVIVALRRHLLILVKKRGQGQSIFNYY